MTEIRTAQSDAPFNAALAPETSSHRESDLPRWAVYLAFAGFCAAMWALALWVVFTLI